MTPVLNKRWLSVLPLVFVLAFLPGGASGVPLQDLFDGENLVVDDKLFHSWSLDADLSDIIIDFNNVDIDGMVVGPQSGRDLVGMERGTHGLQW